MNDGQTGRGRTDDPMSADRRVLTIAAVSMVALVLVGVVSAQLFTRSACAAIDPRPHQDRVAGTDLETVLADGLPDLDDAGREAVVNALRIVADEVGALTGAADVTGAARLGLVGDEVAALGGVTTVLADDTTTVRATEDLEEGTVVGDGQVLYSLALVNELTGQVDALQPLDPADLAPGTCVDTATVGTPLAFHLDAGAGELLLLRTEEDGDEPAIELRDAEAGRVWSTQVEVGTAPAGVLAERVSGRLGDQLVVVGRRIAEDDEGPALLALDRSDGELAWTVDVGTLTDAAPDGDGALWPTVLTVGDELALVALAREDDRDAATVVAVDLTDGSRSWRAAIDAPLTPLAAEAIDGAVWLAGRHGDDVGLWRLDPQDGRPSSQGATPATAGALAVLDDGTAVLAADDTLVLADAERQHAIATDARFVDVAAGDGRLHLLLASDDGAVVVSFAVAVGDG